MNIETSFADKCYELLKLIPQGKVTTYAEMAKALKSRAWRAVGTAMAKNSRLVEIPCHRVVRSDGSIGEYALGPDRKSRLLSEEGVEIINGKVRNFDKYFHKFTDRDFQL